MRDFVHQIVYSADCSYLGFFRFSTPKTPARILTQNTSKDAVPRFRARMCLSGVAKPKLKL